jgi:hypothetical protein
MIHKRDTEDVPEKLHGDVDEPKPVLLDGSAMLDAIAAYIRRFVSVSESQAVVAALWVAHTHAFAAADATSYLSITSAEKQSGKTRLLEVLATLVAKPWFTGRTTAAVLNRKIDAQEPSLLLDESDAAFGGDKEYAEALRGVLNTGHRRGGASSCCVREGSGFTFKDFATFCPKAIAGIGKLPDTVADRAIPIRLKRAISGEVVERFRLRDVENEVRVLRERIEAWAPKSVGVLREARPKLPSELYDRQQDGAEPLLAIADIAGPNWAISARKGLVELCVEAQATDDSTGVLLLRDIKQIFEQKKANRLPSADLARELAGIETSPWGEWSQGKPLTAPKLARLLHPFGITPHSIRVGVTTPKGYLHEDFQDAFRRYLRVECTSYPPSPAPQSATAQQTNAGASLTVFSTYNGDGDVGSLESENASVDKGCCGVALLHPHATTEEDAVEEDL